MPQAGRAPLSSLIDVTRRDTHTAHGDTGRVRQSDILTVFASKRRCRGESTRRGRPVPASAARPRGIGGARATTAHHLTGTQLRTESATRAHPQTLVAVAPAHWSGTHAQSTQEFPPHTGETLSCH